MDKRAVLALHRYYIWASRLREYFYRTISAPDFLAHGIKNTTLAEDAGLFMSHWYAALYVVVEGYQELGLHDSRVDALLSSPHMALLRRFRNGVSHFQAQYYDDRFMDFMGTPNTPEWIGELNRELGRFLLEALRGAPHAEDPAHGTDQAAT